MPFAKETASSLGAEDIMKDLEVKERDMGKSW